MLNVCGDCLSVDCRYAGQPLNDRLSRGAKFAINAYFKLFIEKSVINLPQIKINCKSKVLLAALENKAAVKSGEVLTADMYWLQRTYNCKNFSYRFVSVEKRRYQVCHDS